MQWKAREPIEGKVQILQSRVLNKMFRKPLQVGLTKVQPQQSTVRNGAVELADVSPVEALFGQPRGRCLQLATIVVNARQVHELLNDVWYRLDVGIEK